MILTKFQLPSLKMAATVAKYPKKSENFKSGYPDIRIAQNIRTHEVIIHTKFQLPRLKMAATVAKYPKKSENFKSGYPDIRIA